MSWVGGKADGHGECGPEHAQDAGDRSRSSEVEDRPTDFPIAMDRGEPLA